jgi:hypothetical protein
VPGRGTIGRQLTLDELGKVRGEITNYQRFTELSEQIVELNQAICEARPVEGDQQGPANQTDTEKGGSPKRSRRSSPGRSSG